MSSRRQKVVTILRISSGPWIFKKRARRRNVTGIRHVDDTSNKRRSYALPMQLRGATVLGTVAIDFDRMELYCGDHLLPATSLEFRLLKLFIDNPKRVFTREELIEEVWTKRERATSRTVDNFIRQLRLKFEKDPGTPIFFRTIRGRGYKFVP